MKLSLIRSLYSAPIPEHSIWYIWKCLIQALVSLRTGNLCTEPYRGTDDATGGDSPNVWGPIVHRDIKPDNIFLGDADPAYKFYRRPLLADFGLSFTLDEYDEELQGQDVGDTRKVGTAGWQPPVSVALHALFEGLLNNIVTLGTTMSRPST